MLSHMKLVHTRFSDIKSDLRRRQKDIYDRKARFLSVPNGKVVYIRKESSTDTTGMATLFLRNFDGPYLVTGHPYDRNDLLTSKNLSTGTVLEHPINIKKVVVVPELKLMTFSLLMMLVLKLTMKYQYNHHLLRYL